MSKIANRTILIPQNVTVNLDKENFFVAGPLGQSKKISLPHQLEIISKENNIFTKSENVALAGTYNSLISGMVKGVVEGYEEIVEVKGVGYKVSLKEKKLEFSLGKSHLNYVALPSSLAVKVESNKIIIKGVDKQEVTKFAANDIWPLRKPSVYKAAKGIYRAGGKVIKLKVRKSLNKK